MRFLPQRRRWRALLAAAVVLVGAGIAAVVVIATRPGNVSHPDLQYTAPTTPARTTTRTHTRAASFSWPWYGLSAARTHDFVAPADLHAPFHTGWQYHSGALLEFPPSIDGSTMFFLDDSGVAHAVDVRTGKILWTRSVGTLAAATPAIDPADGLVLMPVLSDDSHSPGGGSFVALSMRTGRVRWRRALPAGSESSPLVHAGAVYFGDGGGTLYALSARTGHELWTYKARGAIKGGPALSGGILYFGDYAGRAYGIRASNGRQVWAVSTQGAHFGLGSGTFYATPAVAYGRVYIGNTDGRMYAFGARNGALAWATGTGAYIYSSAAIADPKGLGPTVYAGSYDGDLYAFNAQTGTVRWRHPAGGRISGSATVIGNVVYYSNLNTHTSTGLNVRTGAQVFTFRDGGFTPVVADEQAVFLIGYSSIYELLPGRAPVHHRASRAKPARHRRDHATKRPRRHR